MNGYHFKQVKATVDKWSGPSNETTQTPFQCHSKCGTWWISKPLNLRQKTPKKLKFDSPSQAYDWFLRGTLRNIIWSLHSDKVPSARNWLTCSFPHPMELWHAWTYLSDWGDLCTTESLQWPRYTRRVQTNNTGWPVSSSASTCDTMVRATQKTCWSGNPPPPLGLCWPQSMRSVIGGLWLVYFLALDNVKCPIWNSNYSWYSFMHNDHIFWLVIAECGVPAIIKSNSCCIYCIRLESR